ncbi:MAG: DinB family protein [Planctomycetes bacterium]|nr:DinB family protein [Planctomycetota bacterium]
MSHLIELARQVRATTIEFVEDVPNDWLLWAPPGTSNHMMWHAGHSLWVQDCLCIERLSGRSELPDGWSDRFGMNCQPVADTRDWPDRGELLKLLRNQLDQLVSLFNEHADRLTHIGENIDGQWDLTRGVIHGLHDEARHQGEMYLLIKLRRGPIES